MLKKCLILSSFVLLLNTAFADEPKIDLRRTKNNNKVTLNLPKVGSDDRGTLGLALLASGTALVVGTLLEGDDNYTTAYYNVNGSLVRDTKPFLEQTPRQIFFMSGVVFGITGLYITIDELNFNKRR